MIRLIKTNIIHLTFGWVFLLGAAAMMFLGVFNGRSIAYYHYAGFEETFEIAAFICAAVTVLNTGREHQDGVLRNKLITGFTRGRIFLSFLISSLISATVLFAFVAVPYFSMLKAYLIALPTKKFVTVILATYLIMLAVAAVCVCFTLCIRQLPIAAVAVFGAAGLCVMAGAIISDNLSAPKYHSDWTITYSDNLQNFEDTDKYPPVKVTSREQLDELLIEYTGSSDREFVGVFSTAEYYQFRANKNEDYVGGAKREVYKAFYNTDPIVQLNSIAAVLNRYNENMIITDAEAEEFVRTTAETNYEVYCLKYYQEFPMYTLVLILLFGAVGLIVFKKINIG